MRGLAAIMIVAMHFTVLWQHRSGSAWQPFPQAALAVDFFFLLSGFVIARAYESRLTAGMTAGRFLEVRFVRLYPLYVLGLSFGVLKQLVGGLVLHDPAASAPARVAVTALFNLFWLPPPLPHKPLDFLFQLNPPAWSLLMEILVNLLFACWLVKRSDRVLLLVIGVGAAILLYGIMTIGSADIGTAYGDWQFGFARALFGFPLGVLLHRRLSRAAPVRSVWALALPALLLLVLATHLPDGARRLLDPIAIFFLFPAMIWIGNRIELPNWAESPANLLGDVSYAVYCVHNPLVMAGVLVAARIGIGMWGATAAFVVGAMIGAALLVRYYDEPVRRRLANILKVRRSAMPQQI